MDPERRATSRAPGRGLLTLFALGVVYGDIGTSPLYAIRECFFGHYAVAPEAANVLGVLSLVTWSLVVVISIKYLGLILRADHHGEGGVLALMELVRHATKGRLRRVVLALGLFGAALLYGDGMITPAISVLSAIEGLEVATPLFKPYVIPLTIGILTGLFAFQRRGTGGVGRVFGPVMLLWFLSIGLLGASAIVDRPEILAAIDPRHAVAFFAANGLHALVIFGIVFLVVTGGEALYADIGHFGTAPIRIGWFTVVLPALLLAYYGQGALILEHGATLSNPFYELAPSWALYPLVVLATAATVIASQAIISGAFSLTYQAYHLGYLPRLAIHHTSMHRRGEIYVPTVNFLLYVATILLVLAFRRSGNLAAAYGVAITTTMVITTALFFVAMDRLFGWPRWATLPLTALFATVDLAFFSANMGKLLDGGWVPLLVAAVLYLVMTTWRRGWRLEQRRLRHEATPVADFLRSLGGGAYRRVPGVAVYVTKRRRGVPDVLRVNLENNRALHRQVVLYTARSMRVPRIDDARRLSVEHLRDDIHRVVATYGFTEVPDVRRDLERVRRQHDLDVDEAEATYFVEEAIPLVDDAGTLPGWQSRLFAWLDRNQDRRSRSLGLPPDRTIEISRRMPL